MKRELKTELTREEVTKLLKLYNVLEHLTDQAGEVFDVDLSTLRDVQHWNYRMKEIFNFAPQADEQGDRPVHWKPYVLADDDRAWFYTPKDDQ